MIKKVHLILCGLLLAVCSLSAWAVDKSSDFYGFRFGMTRAEGDANARNAGLTIDGTFTGQVMYRGKLPGLANESLNVFYSGGKLTRIYFVEWAHETPSKPSELTPKAIYQLEKTLLNEFTKRYGSHAPNYKLTTDDGDRFHSWKLAAGGSLLMKIAEDARSLEVEYSK